MTITFDDALQENISRKLVFVKQTHRKQLIAWTLSGSVYYAPMPDPLVVTGVKENDVAATETASLAALNAQSTATVGAYWFDFENELIYVKPKAATSVFDSLWVATVEINISRDGGEVDSEPYEARVSNVPAITQRTNELFDGKVAEIGAGTIKMVNVAGFLQSAKVELDGQAQVIEQLEVFG